MKKNKQDFRHTLLTNAFPIRDFPFNTLSEVGAAYARRHNRDKPVSETAVMNVAKGISKSRDLTRFLDIHLLPVVKAYPDHFPRKDAQLLLGTTKKTV